MLRTDSPVILVVLVAANSVLLALSMLLPQRAEAAPIPVGEHCGFFDVVVVGSEPEGISAAVAAAESGSRTLLISADDRVGGLFTRGQMNVLDLKTQPFDYQLGLFDRWWREVGRRNSFDVDRAQTAFDDLLEVAGVTLVLGTTELNPLIEGTRVTGVHFGSSVHFGEQLIDATAEMDFAAAAGAGYTFGFESIGLEGRMADTLVFRIAGVDWQALRVGIRERGGAYAASDNWVAWGHFDRYPADYVPQEPGLRMRGLNLGRQEDGTLLVNALLIYGVDPFDPESRAEGLARGAREAGRIVEYLSLELPGFEMAELAGVADELYVRESRHLQAQCTLTIDDVMDNRVTAQDVAAGGYPLDVQTLTPADSGFVYGAPEIYGVRLCMAVPEEVGSLWVVGKAAGFDPLAASSARVVPFGMAFAEAVGVAAARAAQADIQPTELAGAASHVEDIREILLDRGAVLPEVMDREPLGPHGHPAYDAYRLLLSRGLAVGGYGNDPQLDAPVAGVGLVYLLANVATRFLADPAAAERLVSEFTGLEGPLNLETAELVLQSAACELFGECSDGQLVADVLAAVHVNDSAAISRGEMYRLAVGLALD